MKSEFVFLALLVIVVPGKFTACLETDEVIRFNQENPTVKCPGSGAVCEGSSSTCCASKSGEWNCCPFQNAQCCSDGMHCCPSGTTCSAEHSACLPVTKNVTDERQQQQSWPAVRRVRAQESGLSSSVTAGIICPNKISQCPSKGSACCRDHIGRYACCPFPTNVCCDDGIHCCHSGTVCDGLTNRCILFPNVVANMSWTATSSAVIRAVETVEEAADAVAGEPAVVVAEAALQSVVAEPKETYDTRVNGLCPDRSTCGGTCCLLSPFPLRYSCCPYILGSCCPGGLLCCPHGTVCFGSHCLRP